MIGAGIAGESYLREIQITKHAFKYTENPIGLLIKMSLPQNIDKWQLCQPVANKAGGKTAAILDENGGPISFTTNVLRSPFDASGYNDPEASRVSLCLEADEELIEWCTELDAEILKMCRQQSQKLFGKQVYIESDLKSNYFSPLKTNEKYGTSLFKCKLNKIGKGAARVWNKGGLPREMPESWVGLQIQARVVLRSLWIQSRNFGLTFEVADAMICVEADPVTCPFHVLDD